MSIGTGDLFDKLARIGHTQAVRSESTQPDDAEISVAEHDRIGCAPFHIGELFGVYEIDLGFERRVKTEFPRTEFREYRRVAAVDLIFARREYVGDLALENKHRGLRFANYQLCTVFDLLAGDR